MEIRTKVDTYRIEKTCDKCKEGLMISIGSGITAWGTDWEHKCNKCGNAEWFNKTYPTIIHEGTSNV